MSSSAASQDDGDGTVALDDCDDADPERSPDLDEIPYDGIDQDCDGADADDLDGDGFLFARDCDDADPDVNPAATEIPYDGIDQDCDGADADDLDGDGHLAADDCDDDDDTIHPDAEEHWADAFVDNDCDGELEAAPELFGDQLWYSAQPGAALGTRVAPYTEDTFLASAVTAHEGGGAVYMLSSADSGDVDVDATATILAGGPNWYLGVGLDVRDLDGDALPEVAVTAVGGDGAGYVVAGSTLGSRSVALPDDATHILRGSDAAYWGSDVAFLDDVDGDGVGEIAISATYASVGSDTAAGTIAVFGLDRVEHDTTSPDLEWTGYYAGARFGETIAPAGDVDGNGLPDTLVTADVGDVFAVVPGVSGTILEVGISRVTRDSEDTNYRSAMVGDLDGDDGLDVLVLGSVATYAFTGLGSFTLRTTSDAWLTITAAEGSQFGDAIPLGEGTLLTRTWSAADATGWAGILLPEDVGWRKEVAAEDLAITALSTRPGAGHGSRVALVGGTIAFGGPTDDRGASGGGSVALLEAPR